MRRALNQPFGGCSPFHIQSIAPNGSELPETRHNFASHNAPPAMTRSRTRSPHCAANCANGRPKNEPPCSSGVLKSSSRPQQTAARPPMTGITQIETPCGSCSVLVSIPTSTFSPPRSSVFACTRSRTARSRASVSVPMADSNITAFAHTPSLALAMDPASKPKPKPKRCATAALPTTASSSSRVVPICRNSPVSARSQRNGVRRSPAYIARSLGRSARSHCARYAACVTRLGSAQRISRYRSSGGSSPRLARSASEPFCIDTLACFRSRTPLADSSASTACGSNDINPVSTSAVSSFASAPAARINSSVGFCRNATTSFVRPFCTYTP